MCTSLTLKTKDGHHILARTMDFGMSFNQAVHFVPRNFKWYNCENYEKKKTKYAFIGMGVSDDNHPVLADGVNEKGVTCATLYFPGFAEYEKKNNNEKENLAPYNIVFWILSQFKSVREVTLALNYIEIIDKNLGILGVVPPLHWMVSDKSGKSIVIEKTKRGIEVYNSPVGVLSNSPNFEWHLTNLRQYIGIKPQQNDPIKMENLRLSPIGQGSGTFGLPGDFTPPSRFIRAAYLKNNITHLQNEMQGVTGAFHILSNCAVPKGAVVKYEGNEDSTLYISAMCSESATYYFNTYENNQISAVHLFNEDLEAENIKVFPASFDQVIQHLN